MTNILSEMQDSLQRYAKITSQVLQIPITVIDKNQTRINYEGGKWTGRANVGRSMSERGGISRVAIQTGESQVLLEPHSHPACQNCPNKDTCYDCVELWVPIKLHQTVIGAIAINCETKRQIQHVRKNWKNHLQFLEQLAELIAFDAKQRIEVQKDQAVIGVLTATMNRIESGVLILNADGNILQSNLAARQMLVSKFPDFLESSLNITATGEIYKTHRMYRLQSGGDSCVVVGNLYQLHWDTYTSLLIFDAVDRTPKDAPPISAFYQIVGTSSLIQQVRNQIETAAHSHSCVLLQAENGLGKELYARAIHDESDRCTGPFVSINCALLPRQDMEKYLFGISGDSSKAGARGQPGELEQANGGTLFLDNISALPYAIQRRLAKMVEQQEIVRIGSKKKRRINIRLITGTDRDLREICGDDDFDLDFYYLINVLHITIPPLRTRPEDIRPLASYYVHRYSQELGKNIVSIEEGFWALIEGYGWPGNVRELQSCMERVVNMMDHGTIQAKLLPDTFQTSKSVVQLGLLNLEALEKEAISRALILQRQENLSMEKIAKILGIGSATLYRKIKKYQL